MSFQNKLTAKEFVILAEMHTPKGVNISRLIGDARKVKGRIDAVVIPGMDNGIMRMSALGGAVLMKQEGIEPLMHVYCRDRNRMALQGDLLAAHVLGVENIVVAYSEDITEGDHRDAKPVDDISEVQLLEAIGSLQRGKDMEGFELDGIPAYTTGCTLGTYTDDKSLATQIELAKEKVAAGAKYIITPPVFDLDHFKDLSSKLAHLHVPVIPTVFLIKSLAIAQYIATTDPSSHITDDLISRIRKSKDREAEGIKVAGEMVSGLRDLAQGVVIQTLGWEYKLAEILDAAGI